MTPAKAEPNYCPHCGDLFMTWDGLAAHVSERHRRKLYRTGQIGKTPRRAS